MAGTEVNTAFCRMMFVNVCKDLDVVLGREKARKLIKENMDVTPWKFSPRGKTAFLHWVADGEVLTEDIYKYKTCTTRWEAKYEAVVFLLHKLRPEEGY